MLALLTTLALSAPAYADDEADTPAEPSDAPMDAGGPEDEAEPAAGDQAEPPAGDQAEPAAGDQAGDETGVPPEPADTTAPADEATLEIRTPVAAPADDPDGTDTSANAPAASDAFPVQVAPSPHGVGVGIILGAPTGLSVAWRPEGRSTAVAGLAWNFTERKLHVHGDYLFTVYDLRVPEAPGVSFPLYVGIGGRVRMGGQEGFDLGIRVPIGLNVLPDTLPIDGFIELVPVVGLFPDTELDFEGGIGARVFFQ